MSWPRFIRASTRWVMLAGTVGVLTLWLLSGWFRVFFYGPAPGSYLDCKIEAGRIEGFVMHSMDSPALRQSCGIMKRPKLELDDKTLLRGNLAPTPSPKRFYWWGRWCFPMQWSIPPTKTYTATGIEVPLWPLALSLSALTACPWIVKGLKRVRRYTGLCATCGYDRRGIATESVCPECGAPA